MVRNFDNSNNKLIQRGGSVGQVQSSLRSSINTTGANPILHYAISHSSYLLDTLSPIGRIQILTYLIWGILGAAIFDCIIRSCDLFDWFIRTCFVPTVIPAVITSLELFFVLTMCYFSDTVSSKENIKII